MTNHSSRTAAALARRTAQAAGYFIRQGSYSGTTDDRLGRWYFGHESDEFFRPYGAGHATQSAAWLAAVEQIAMDAV